MTIEDYEDLLEKYSEMEAKYDNLLSSYECILAYVDDIQRSLNHIYAEAAEMQVKRDD